jgi:hypothetical protein
MVLDLDALHAAMSLAPERHHIAAHLPIVTETQDAALERLLLGGHQVRRCWVNLYRAGARSARPLPAPLRGPVVVLWWPEEACLLRAMRERSPQWQEYVRRWFDRSEPDSEDEVLRSWQLAG